MGLAVNPLSPALGAEITGALLARPAAEEIVAVLRRALLDHLVVVVRDRPRHHLRDRLRKAEVPIVYGPGRHPPSGSFFLYFLDPDGMTLEYSHGMEEFPESRFAAAGSVEEMRHA